MTYNISELFEAIKNSPPYPETYSGRGIVISAGGSYLPSAYIAIKSIRACGCKLPIQVWHLGYQEFPDELRLLFYPLGVEVVDALEVRKIHPIKNLKGWESKPFSIVYSPFKEVLSLDADNFVLLNPEYLFDYASYKEHGSVFWPDFLSDKQEYWMIKPGAWELLGLAPQQGLEIETGQVLINKEKSWRALWVALHMNANSDFFYEKCTYGDTDTYTLAWLLCEQTRVQIPYQAKKIENWIRIHYDPSGQELFQHSRKWVLPLEQNPDLKSYRFQDMGLIWLQEFASCLSAYSKI